MNYKIVVEHEENGYYRAYSPVAAVLSARGESVAVVLENLRNIMLCYLHDPEAELELVLSFSGDKQTVELARTIV